MNRSGLALAVALVFMVRLDAHVDLHADMTAEVFQPACYGLLNKALSELFSLVNVIPS